MLIYRGAENLRKRTEKTSDKERERRGKSVFLKKKRKIV